MFIPVSDENDLTTTPYVTYGLLVLNLLIFLLTMGDPGRWFATWGLVPATLEPGSLVTLITSQFLHAGIWHLLGNLLFLWIFGDNVEDWLGHTGFLAFYLGTGAAAGLAHALWNPDSVIPTVGASGAISGVMGAYLVLLPHNRITVWCFFFYVLTRIEVPAVLVVILYIGKDLVFALTDLYGSNVAYWAHLGGCLAGILVTLLLRSIFFGSSQRALMGGRDVGRPRQGPPSYLVDAGQLDAHFLELLARGDSGALAESYIHVAGRMRNLPVSDAVLFQVAGALIDAGHETVGGNALARLALAPPGSATSKEAHAALADLFWGPLRDRIQARHHATTALEEGVTGTRARALEELLEQLPPFPQLELGGKPAAIFHIEQARLDRRAVGRLVAEHTGAHLIDAVNAVRLGCGILATDVPASVTPTLLEDLRRAGVEALAAPMELLSSPPEPVLVRHLHAGAERLDLEVDGEAPLHLPWEAVACAMGGFLRERQLRTRTLAGEEPIEVTGSVSGHLGIRAVPSRRGDSIEVRVRGRLDLLVGDGEELRRYQVREARCGIVVATKRQALTSRVAIQQLAQAVLGHDELMYVAGGVAALAGLEDPSPCTCRDEQELDMHHRYWWLRYRLSGLPELTRPAFGGGD